MDEKKMRLGLYRKIEIARKQLPDMDEEAFRDRLRNEYGISSRKDMSVAQLSYAFWATLWLSECWRVARSGSPCLVFTDWRQLPSLTDAIQLPVVGGRGESVMNIQPVVVGCQHRRPRVTLYI